MPVASKRLPDDARRRLETFAGRVERLRLEELPMYAVRPIEPAHGVALERAEAIAASIGLGGAVDEARDALAAYVARVFTGAQFRASGAALDWGSLGTTEDRVRVTRSLGDAGAAIVLGDALDESDRAEMLGQWASLIE